LVMLCELVRLADTGHHRLHELVRLAASTIFDMRGSFSPPISSVFLPYKTFFQQKALVKTNFFSTKHPKKMSAILQIFF